MLIVSRVSGQIRLRDPSDSEGRFASDDRTRVRLGVHEIKAVAENISPGGAFLRVSLPEGARRLLAVIDLPHGKRLSVEARVCWHRADGVGIQFESFHR